MVPPVLFYVVDPRIDAVNRAKRGIKVEGEEDAWNVSMPLSQADKKRDLVGKATILGATALFGGLMCWMGF